MEKRMIRRDSLEQAPHPPHSSTLASTVHIVGPLKQHPLLVGIEELSSLKSFGPEWKPGVLRSLCGLGWSEEGSWKG